MILALLAVMLVALPADAMTTDPASIIALVRATPELAIDTTLVAPGGWNATIHPYVKFKHNEYATGGFIDADYASIGTLDGGTRVMAVPLDSGGSRGVFTQILFAQGINDAKPFFVGAIDSGGHLAVNVTFHGIVAILPDYGPHDANCCPSKYAIETYTIIGRTLKLLARHTAAKQ